RHGIGPIVHEKVRIAFGQYGQQVAEQVERGGSQQGAFTAHQRGQVTFHFEGAGRGLERRRFTQRQAIPTRQPTRFVRKPQVQRGGKVRHGALVTSPAADSG